jgi:hypothetical protein
MSNDEFKETPIDDLEYKHDITRPQYIDGISKDYKNEVQRDDLPPSDDLEKAFGFFTQDLRLGNLSTADMKRAEFFLNFAGRCSRLGLSKPFSSSLLKVASIIELSQSHKGWLRKFIHTQNIRQESSIEEKSEDKSWLFKRKKQSNNMNPYNMVSRRW